MQKKNGDIAGIEILVLIIDTAIKIPTKYAPPSPKKILALGKLNSKKEIKIIICPVKKKENSKWLLFKLTNNKIEFIIIRLIAKRPLNPSIKLAPFIINKKHRSIKIFEKIIFSNHEFKKIKSIFLISMDRRLMNTPKNIIININLELGLILIFKSSK